MIHCQEILLLTRYGILKYERGYFLASTPLYETEDCFFYVGTETEGRIVDSMKKNIKLLCQSAIVPFISFFLLLCIVRLCWYAWHGLKKVLVRVVMVMVVLLTLSTANKCNKKNKIS